MNDQPQPTVAQLVAALPTLAVSGPLDAHGDGGDLCLQRRDSWRGVRRHSRTQGRRTRLHPRRAGAWRGLVVGEQRPPADFPADRTYAQVADARRELGTLSAAFYGDPSRQMDVIGVTGTDGKTTTSSILHWLLLTAGRRVGLMSTVDVKIGAETFPNNSRFTTLEAPEVQGQLRRMADAGVECAVVETTSSGLALHRVWGVAYDLAVITNITSEHLEVHGTLEAYRRAKAMLFEAVDPGRARQARRVQRAAWLCPQRRRSLVHLPQGASAARPSPPMASRRRRMCAPSDLDLRPDGSSFSVRLPDGQRLQGGDAARRALQCLQLSRGHRGGLSARHRAGSHGAGAGDLSWRAGADGTRRGRPTVYGGGGLRAHRRQPGEGAERAATA